MPRKTTQKPKPLPVQWEELTASDFPAAVKQASGVCLLPIGVIEKHGPHLPLGTDVMAARAASIRAAQREYAVVFPYYYFGQIYEARHQPGCITIRPELLNELLQEMCDEIARNGFDKILIVNGHGGNIHWLHYFCQVQLATPTDYVVYMALRDLDPETRERIRAMRKTDFGGHADEVETSWMMAIRGDLVQLDRAGDEDGRPQGRLKNLRDAYTAMWWYANFPNHYAGDASSARIEIGETALEGWASGLVQVIRSVKKDAVTPKLQQEFYERSLRPTTPARRTRR
jgi:creatinine amidohydrolase